MSTKLESLTIRGYKTIQSLEKFKPADMNVLIGPNGVGKSNFISFFRLLSHMLSPTGNLQSFTAAAGGASALLHKGPKVTRDIQAGVVFHTEAGANEYEFWLSHAAGDTLIFTNERYRFSRFDRDGSAPWRELQPGSREARLTREAELGDRTAEVMLSLMRRWNVYQFHDTSWSARIRQKWDANDNRWLKEDGANLAAVLLRLREEEPPNYRRIVDILRLILPFFADFELSADKFDRIILQWRERDGDLVFSASQAADGMLRCMALVTLLSLPQDSLPSVLVLDEPELGLHPYAINVIAGLLHSVSRHVQVFVATQSTRFLDYFAPEEIVVLERSEGATTFRRQTEERLAEWLEEYSLSELWEKNVLGGAP